MLAALLLLLPGGVGYRKMTDDTVAAWRRGGRQVRGREGKGGDGGGGRGAKGERWSAGSGSVSASVSATAGSSSSACHVGCKALCVCLSELLHDNYYFKFVCI